MIDTLTKKVFIILLIILFFSCKPIKNDLIGIWISEDGNRPSFIIENDTLILSSQVSIKKFKYKIKNNQIILTDSIGIWKELIRPVYLSKKKYYDTFKIKSYDKNTLILTYKILNFKLKKVNTLNKKVINIRLFLSNGWNYTSFLNIDSLGVFRIIDDNYWKNEKRIRIGKINKKEHERILLLSNYIYDNKIMLNKSSCCDCFSYGLSLFSKDSIKSYYCNESSIHSFISMVVTPLVFLRNESIEVKKDTNLIIENKFFGYDTVIIEKIKTQTDVKDIN